MTADSSKRRAELVVPSFKQGKLSERVFASLRDNILSGKLHEGDKLPSQDILALNFGVSRTVIREAVNRLSSLGLLKSEQGRGTFVRAAKPAALMDPFFADLRFERTAIQELLEVRYYLERAVVTLAAKRVTADEIQVLEAAIAEMEKSLRDGDLERFAAADTDFHMALAQTSKNETLKMILDTIRESMRAFIEKFNRVEGAMERAVAFHRSICSAVAQKDPRRADREMTAHLRDVAQALHQQYGFEFDF